MEGINKFPNVKQRNRNMLRGKQHICQRMGHMGSWQFKAFKVTSQSLHPQQENSWLESVRLIGFGTTA